VRVRVHVRVRTHTHTHTHIAGVWERIGESTEAALKVLAEKIGAAGQGSEGDTPANDYWAAQHQRLAVLEFNRERKSMSVLVGNKSDDKGTLLVKGATEMVLQRCSKMRLASGQTVELTNDFRKEFIKFVEDNYASGKHILKKYSALVALALVCVCVCVCACVRA
jgi:magnesium-transporting ATPase (P-type)